LDREVGLAASLEEVPSTPVLSLVPAGLTAEGDTAAEVRAPVRQEEEALAQQEALRDVAHAQHRPSAWIETGWTQVAYPIATTPAFDDFRPNWTVTARLSVPIYTGGRIKGDERVADAGVEEARARVEQTRERAGVDSRNALDQLSAAEAAWAASVGVVEQAEKAYEIAEIRFAEGIATQLDVMDARILLEQAGANRATSARNLQVARLRVALLPYLPLALDLGGAPSVLPVAPAERPRERPQMQTTPTGTGSVLAAPGGGR
jgi:outer membrane protein TolC